MLRIKETSCLSLLVQVASVQSQASLLLAASGVLDFCSARSHSPK